MGAVIDRFGLFGVDQIAISLAARASASACSASARRCRSFDSEVSLRAKVWTALWAVYIIWGSTYLGIAIAGETIPPLLAVSTRFIAAGAIMAAIVLLPRRLAAHRRGARSARASLIGCLLPGANAVLFFAERNVPTGLASLIIASVPLWVVVLRLARRRAAAVARRSPASASASPASRAAAARRAARRRSGSASACSRR